MLRSAISAVTRVFDALRRCAADPGAIFATMGPGSAAQRCTQHRVWHKNISTDNEALM